MSRTPRRTENDLVPSKVESGADEVVEVVVHKIDELRREQETARRKGAAARILELSKGKSLGGITVRELIEEGRRL